MTSERVNEHASSRSPRPSPADVDAYIAGFPPAVRERLQQVRATIHRALPQATEVISYQIPTFQLRTNVVHYAAFTNHISFYPAPWGVPEFEADIATYGAGKGTLRFPNDAPLPLDLIERVARFRAHEHDDRETARTARAPKAAREPAPKRDDASVAKPAVARAPRAPRTAPTAPTASRKPAR